MAEYETVKHGSITWRRLVASKGVSMIAEQDYFLDADDNVVSGDDENAAFLLIRKGQEIPADMVKKYGIGKSRAKAETEDEAVEGEKASNPTENKAATPARNKRSK